MENVIITEVTNRFELRRFIKFPNRLFKDVPTYIPPLMSDELGLLSKKNPSLEHSDCKLWLAYRGRKIVGRVAGIINRSVNDRWQKKAVRFGWFDFVEDYEVFEKLLQTVIEYGKAKGMNEIEGPFGFTDMDKECWAIDNFDARQNISTLYNPKYYIDYITRAGFEIGCRWGQHRMPASQPIPEKVERINQLIIQRYDLKLLKFNKTRDAWPYARKFFYSINSSFKDLYDFVPLTEKEITVYVNEYFPFLNPRLATFVVDKDDNLVAFGLSIPDLNAAYKKANGSLFPFGWYHILRALHKFKDIDLLLNGVLPEWQKRGIHSIYYSDMNRTAQDLKLEWAYTNPQIIGNEAEKIWNTTYQTEQLMTRAIFKRKIDPTC